MQPAHQLFSLTGKAIVITGASSGIGRQCALTCNELGAFVILTGRNKERLEETFSLLKYTDNALYYPVDLTDYEQVPHLVDIIISKGLLINGIIHSAGISTTLPFKMITPEKLSIFFQTNVFAGINLTRLLFRSSLISDKASIVFIASVMGFLGENAKSLYGMTKGALIAAVKSLAIEYASRAIRINAVSPGVVETPMSEKSAYSRNEEAFQRIKELHPLGIGKPQDVANACAYLLSDASRWVTGTNLVIDGGYSAR
jgi:NAD(P)-dependent dehydrogenase (short-subunit alcohol dehydrogenase family)